MKNYFKDLNNGDTQKQMAVYMHGFDSVQRGKYFGGEPIRITAVEVRVRSLRTEMLQVMMRSQQR